MGTSSKIDADASLASQELGAVASSVGAFDRSGCVQKTATRMKDGCNRRPW